MSTVSRVGMRAEAAKQEVTWEELPAYLRYWSWQFVTKFILGLIYLAVISEGLRALIPPLGQKIYKLPLLSFLKDYEATYRLDLAPFFALFLLVAVFVLWRRIIVVWLSYEDAWLWSQEDRLVVGLGCLILGADSVLFYYAMTQMGWGNSVFSFSAFVAAGAYVGVLVFVSYMSVKLNPGRKG